MSHVIKIVERLGGLVQNTDPRAAAGAEWVKSFDPEAFDGRGDLVTTFDKDQALRFRSGAEAFAFWRQQSTTRPVREDGHPNRPLCAFTVEIERWRP